MTGAQGIHGGAGDGRLQPRSAAAHLAGEAAAAVPAFQPRERRCTCCGTKLVLPSGYCSACTACMDEGAR